MALKSKSIQTSVDKLVSLIEEYKRISVKEASKQLSTPVETIKEWAVVLEEENIIDVDYKLNNPILVKKELTKSQQKAKIKSFNDDRGIFNKKIEAASSYMNELDKKINKITDLFENMEKNMNKKLSIVDEEMKLISKTDREKRALHKKIVDSKLKSDLKLKELANKLSDSRRSYVSNFTSAEKEIIQNEVLLKKSTEFLDMLLIKERELQVKIRAIKEVNDKIEKAISKRADSIKEVETKVRTAKENHDSFKKEILQEKKELDSILKENISFGEKVNTMQNDLYSKISKEEANLEKRERELIEIPKRIDAVFKKKSDIKKILKEMTTEGVALKAAVAKLEERAKLLQYSLGKENYELEMSKINAEINNVNSKRDFFKSRVETLFTLLNFEENGK